MSRFPPQPEVLTAIKLTRPAYAQLLGQKFHPPKIFGQWQASEGTDEWRWRDVGMKLVNLNVSWWSSQSDTTQACGFEMLYQESKTRATTADILNSSVCVLRSRPRYHADKSESDGGTQGRPSSEPGVSEIHREPRFHWLLQRRN